MKNILITGGAGFIGSHVAKNLRQRGLNPVIFDRRKTTADADVILGDTRDFTSLNEAVGVCDGVIHLAGVLGTSETINEPRPAVETNIVGGLNFCQAVRNSGKRAVYISVGNHWMNNSYSITKDTAERFVWMFNREHGTQIAVVRGLNAYGPGQKAAPVRKIAPNFILPALRGEVITVYGDGNQIMDMIFVEDLADILVRALLVDHGQFRHDPAPGKPAPRFEAGTGAATSVNDIAKAVIEIVGQGSINHVPMRGGEPVGAIVLAETRTLRPLFDGKLPELIPLREGLARTIEYYRGQP